MSLQVTHWCQSFVPFVFLTRAVRRRAGAAIIDGEVGGEDVADVIAYLEREGAAPEGGSGSGGE